MKQEKPLIKKVVYNYSYGCWGIGGRLKRAYVVFEQNKITYCFKPLEHNLNKDNCLIKAAGGVRSHEDMLKMIELGANRIGTSSGTKLIEKGE